MEKTYFQPSSISKQPDFGDQKAHKWFVAAPRVKDSVAEMQTVREIFFREECITSVRMKNHTTLAIPLIEGVPPSHVRHNRFH